MKFGSDVNLRDQESKGMMGTTKISTSNSDGFEVIKIQEDQDEQQDLEAEQARGLQQVRYGLFQTQSATNLIDYFEDGENDNLVMEKMHDKYFYVDHNVSFSYSQYLEFFIHHILNFVILGPFINLYTLIFRHNPYLMYNLQFAPRVSVGFFVQNFFWAISIYTYYVIFFTESVIGDYNCLIIIVFSYLARAAPIAGKYGTYPRNKIEHLKKHKLTYKEIEKELMLVGWFAQRPDIVAIEIDATMKRNEIDDTIFRLSFMGNIRSAVEEKLIEISKQHPDYYSIHKAKDSRKCV